MKNAMRSVFPDMTTAEIRQLFAQLDADNNEEICFDEFHKLLNLVQCCALMHSLCSYALAMLLCIRYALMHSLCPYAFAMPLCTRYALMRHHAIMRHLLSAFAICLRICHLLVCLNVRLRTYCLLVHSLSASSLCTHQIILHSLSTHRACTYANCVCAYSLQCIRRC